MKYTCRWNSAEMSSKFIEGPAKLVLRKVYEILTKSDENTQRYECDDTFLQCWLLIKRSVDHLDIEKVMIKIHLNAENASFLGTIGVDTTEIWPPEVWSRYMHTRWMRDPTYLAYERTTMHTPPTLGRKVPLCELCHRRGTAGCRCGYVAGAGSAVQRKVLAIWSTLLETRVRE